MRLNAVFFLGLVCFACMTACSNERPAHSTSTTSNGGLQVQPNTLVNPSADADAIRQALLEYDFSEDLALVLCKTLPRSEDAKVRAYIGLKASSAKSFVPEDELVLGVREVPEIGWWSTRNTIALISSAFAKNGLQPRDATDLFDELSTRKGVDLFNRMSPHQRISRYLGGINPVTKRFYSGFDLLDREPGGIVIEPLAKQPDGVFISSEGVVGFVDVNGDKGIYADAGSRPQTDGAYMYKVFSADGKNELYRDYCSYEKIEDGAAQDRPGDVSPALSPEKADPS